MSARLRVAVPAVIEHVDPHSGVGKMWTHVLAGLGKRADVRFTDPGQRSGFLRRKPEVWLSDCGLGALGVRDRVVVQVHEAGWDDDEVRATLDSDFLDDVLEGRVGDAVRAAEHIITPSDSARRQVMGHWGVPGDRVHAVPHGVDADVFRPGRSGGRAVLAQTGADPEIPYVVFVSQIHPRKNLGALRQAMAELAAEGFPHQLVIVGGPAQDRLDSQALLAEAAADLPGAPGRVVRLTQLPEPDLADLMAGASAFCLPSLMEGFGMTALEAMACGVPVVVSDRGSLPEVVGDAGIVVAPRAEAMRDALAAVLGDDERAATLGRAARERALGFSWRRTVDGWYDVLRLAARRA